MDNGTSISPDDLSDATERKITYFINGTSELGLGLPNEIEERYFDFQTGEEKLLKKIVNIYSSKNLVEQQDIYDADLVYRYSLFTDYDDAGRPTMQKDALGQVTRMHYDRNGNLERLEDPRGDHEATMKYDRAGRLIQIEKFDNLGNRLVTEKDYDLLNRCIADIDECGNTTSYEYDALGRLYKTTYPPIRGKSAVVIKKYDAVGNIISETDEQNYTTTRKFNAFKKPIEIHYPDGTYEKFKYSLQGQLVHYQAKTGTITEYERDYQDRITKETLYSSEGKLLSCTTKRYAGDSLIEEKDAEGAITHYRYDGAGRLVAMEKGERLITYEWDALGRKHYEKAWFGTEPNDYTLTIFEYDLADQLTGEILADAAGNTVLCTRYVYDADGNKTHVITYDKQGNPQTQITDYNYLRMPIKLTDALGNETWIHLDWNFVNHGQRVLKKTVTDALGNVTESIYNARGHAEILTKKNAIGQILVEQEATYDLAGNKVEEIHTVMPSGRQVINKWRYGPLNRLEEVQEGLGTENKVTRYEYNRYGQLAKTIKPSGKELIKEYDALGRVSCYQGPDFYYQYTYDRNHRLKRIVDGSGNVTEKNYDIHGNIYEEKLGNGLTVNIDYDRAGNRTLLTLPDSSQTRYHYYCTLLASVERVSPYGEIRYTHQYSSYDPSGRILESKTVNGVPLEFSYDPCGRAATISSASFEEKIRYDVIGNLKHLAIQDPVGKIQCDFDYDDLYQLQEESGIASHRYLHDSLSNRIEYDGKAQQVNDLNQLLHDSLSEYEYDADKCLVRSRNGVLYRYDSLDQLIEVELSNSLLTYTYDAFDRRLTKKVFERTGNSWNEISFLRFLYDGQNEIGAVDDQGNIVELRILGQGLGAELGAAIALEINTSLYIPIHDHRGNLALLLNEQGEAVETYRYSAFGEQTIYDSSGQLKNSSLNPWRFSSKRIEDETGLIYFGRRFYDPCIGKWLTPDPQGYEDGPNLYAYVLNNPLSHFDLYGLFISPAQYSLFETGRTATENLPPVVSDYGIYERLIPVKNGPSRCFDVGTQTNKDLGIFFVNGMDNMTYDSYKSAKAISGYANGERVRTIYNATQGLCGDVGKCILSYLGITTTPVELLRRECDNFFKNASENAKLLLIMHSGGAGQGKNFLLSYPENLRKRIFAVCIAPQSFVDPKTCAKVFHYQASPRRDFVPRFDFIGAARAKGTIYTLESHPDAPLHDHNFLSPTYANPLFLRVSNYHNSNGQDS